jgi:hypothetical protein
MEPGPPDLARRYAWRRMARVAGWVAVAGAVSLMGWRLATDPLIRGLSSRSLDYGSLAVALLVASATQLLYCSRWHWFLRVVQVPVSWLEAVSAALMAQLVGSLAIGSAGSDVYRGVVTGRGRAGHRMGVVASILADRVAGLYSLICLAALAATFTPGTGRWQVLRAASLPVLWAAVAAGGACILTGLFFNLGPALAWTRHWPLLHKAVVPMLTAVERFRSRPGIYALGIASGIVSHALGAATLWLVARGIGVPHPSLAEHQLIGPLAVSTAILPLPMAGLGATELVLDGLYQTAVPEAAGAGLVVGMVARILGVVATALLTAAFMPLSCLVHSSDRGGGI